MYLFDRATVREVDRLAAAEFVMPTVLLMENAARHAADVALDWVERLDSPRVMIVCGRGNNGGDGLAMARHLFNAGLEIVIAILPGNTRGKSDMATQLKIIKAMKLPMYECSTADPASTLDEIATARGGVDLIVDALVGTGLDRTVSGPLESAIEGINRLRSSGAKVLSVDVPSGLDSESGQPLGNSVIADVTVTFVGLKRGFLAAHARKYLGEVVVADIGVPRILVERLGKRLPSTRLFDRERGAIPRPRRRR